MKKAKLKNNTFVYPMPMVIAGAVLEERVNSMPVGWVSRANHNPPMIALAMGKSHYTNGDWQELRARRIGQPIYL